MDDGYYICTDLRWIANKYHNASRQNREWTQKKRIHFRLKFLPLLFIASFCKLINAKYEMMKRIFFRENSSVQAKVNLKPFQNTVYAKINFRSSSSLIILFFSRFHSLSKSKYWIGRLSDNPKFGNNTAH